MGQCQYVLSEELLTREEYIPSIFSRYLVTVINSVAVTGSLQVQSYKINQTRHWSTKSMQVSRTVPYQ